MGVFSCTQFASSTYVITKCLAELTEKLQDQSTQISAAARLRQLTIDVELRAADRDMLSASLSECQSQDYAPQSGQITGILKQMKDTSKPRRPQRRLQTTVTQWSWRLTGLRLT